MRVTYVEVRQAWDAASVMQRRAHLKSGGPISPDLVQKVSEQSWARFDIFWKNFIRARYVRDGGWSLTHGVDEYRPEWAYPSGRLGGVVTERIPGKFEVGRPEAAVDDMRRAIAYRDYDGYLIAVADAVEKVQNSQLGEHELNIVISYSTVLLERGVLFLGTRRQSIELLDATRVLLYVAIDAKDALPLDR